jgi:predicted acetyltransferase
MSDVDKVSIDVAEAHHAALISNLLQLYLHDLSEAFPAIELGANGRFEYENLSRYWSEPKNRFPFLIGYATKAVGFALITRGSPASDDPNVFDIAEFFVLRRYRRSGVGRRAAFLLWDRLSGSWTVRVADTNRGLFRSGHMSSPSIPTEQQHS